MATEQQQALREKREAVVLEHVQSENRHDVAASVATFHTPCYRVMPMGIVHDGRPGCERVALWHLQRFS